MKWVGAPCAHLIVDGVGMVGRCNEGLVELVGRSEDELVGKSFHRLFTLPSRLFLQTHVFPLLQAEGRIRDVQLDLVTSTNTKVPVLLNAVQRPVDGSDETEVVLVDMSWRASHEQAILKSKREAEAARTLTDRTLEQVVQLRKLESLSLMAKGMAHDLNNQLCAVLGNLQLLHDLTDGNSVARSLIEDAEGAASSAAKVAAQMLSYAGAEMVVHAPLEIDPLLSELKAEVHPPSSQGVTCFWNLAAPKTWLQGDPVRLKSVVRQLIINAIEAIAPGVGTITVETRTRQLDRCELQGFHAGGVQDEGEYLELCVSDTGSGMDALTRVRAFEPFYSTKSAGRGLGLAEVLGAVHAHGGGVRLESAPGLGSTFTIVLPIAGNPQTHHPSPLRPRKILVLASCRMTGTLLARILAKHDFEPFVMHDALSVIQRTEMLNGFSAVIIDDSVEAALSETLLDCWCRLRPSCPVLLPNSQLSGIPSSTKGVPKNLAHLSKPFRAAQLIGALEALFDAKIPPLTTETGRTTDPTV